jgi:hypothetical protein
MRPSPGIVGYTYTLLHNRLLALVRRLVADTEAAESGTLREDAGVCALGAIVLADAVVEIAMNHVIEKAFPPRSLRPDHWPVHQFAFERLARIRPPLERLKALTEMQRRSPKWDEEPWTSVRDLHAVRNAVMHYESGPVQSTDPKVNTFPRATELQPIARRLGTIARYESGGTWLDAFLNSTVAKWAEQTATATTRVLDSGEWRVYVATGPSDLTALRGFDDLNR